MLGMNKMYFLWKGKSIWQRHLHVVSWFWKRNLSVSYTVSYLFKINLSLITVRKAEMEGYHETTIAHLVTIGHEGTPVSQVCWHWCCKDCQQCSIHLHPCSCARVNLPHTVLFWTIHLLPVLCKDMCVSAIQNRFSICSNYCKPSWKLAINVFHFIWLLCATELPVQAFHFGFVDVVWFWGSFFGIDFLIYLER